jgi:hypothetical protein
VFADDAISLWVMRDEAELDCLASIALDPRRLFPYMRDVAKVRLEHFACQRHQIAFVMFEAYHRKGDIWCQAIIERALKLAGHDERFASVMFDRLPPIKSMVERCAERLIRLADACDRSQNMLDAARAEISRALAEPKYIRSVGGKTDRGVHRQTV